MYPNLRLLVGLLNEDTYGVKVARAINVFGAVVHVLPTPIVERAEKIISEHLIGKVETFAVGDQEDKEKIIGTNRELMWLDEFVNDLYDGEQGWVTKYYPVDTVAKFHEERWLHD